MIFFGFLFLRFTSHELDCVPVDGLLQRANFDLYCVEKL